MTTAVDQFIGKLQRTLGSAAASYRVTSVNEPYINQTLEHCLVLERVGQGAMSVVYKAKQEMTDRIVAIKMLRAQLCCDPSNVKRFQREAKAIARLSHTNLLNVFAVGRTASGQPYIVMDFVEGRSLAEVVAKEGQIEWKRAAGIFVQVCDAMQHAHANRIIHRDLKPDNIMLLNSKSGADLIKVVDFGIVKLTDESQALSQRLTQTGEVWGSPIYMSPEQCMGHELDHRSDIYSLGTVLYEVLTGKQVFSGKRITDIVMKQMNEKPQPFVSVRPELGIPAWLEQVTMKALEKDAHNRFASMEEMKRTIEKGLMSQKDTADAQQKPLLTPTMTDHPRAYQPPVDPFVGTMIGEKYNVQSLIGEGGMSVVYKAVQEGINRSVAIKLLRDELCDDESNVKRFKREAKSVSQLSHPNLVAIYDVGQAHTGQPYMVMEFLEGRALIDVIESSGKMSVDRALPIFIQICDVMQYAHSKGYIHRDLKPHNVMLVSAGDKPDFVKLVDFGIVAIDSAHQAVSQKLTAAGEICGSPIYMSPEQVLDEKIDNRSDIYSLGIMMYECLTGRPAFGGKRITDVMNKHVNTQPPSFSEACPDGLDVPPTLEGIVLKTLEKSPSARYQTMEDLKQALIKVAKKQPVPGIGMTSLGLAKPAPQAPPSIEVVAVQKQGAPVLVLLLVAALVGAVIAGGAVLLYLSSQKHEPTGTTTTTSAPPTKSITSGSMQAPQQPQAQSTVSIEQPQARPVKKAATKPVRKHSNSNRNQENADLLQTIEDAHLKPAHPDAYGGMQ